MLYLHLYLIFYSWIQSYRMQVEYFRSVTTDPQTYYTLPHLRVKFLSALMIWLTRYFTNFFTRFCDILNKRGLYYLIKTFRVFQHPGEGGYVHPEDFYMARSC